MQLGFNLAEIQPSQSVSFHFELGNYPLEITKAEPLPVNNKPNSGKLEVTFTVFDGAMKGATIKTNYNLWNESEQAKRIARQQFAALCHAIGRPHASETEHLIGGKCIGLCGPQLSDEKYSEVKKVFDLNGNAPGEAPTAATAAAPVQQAATAPPPYQAPAPAATAPAQTGWGANPGPAVGGWQNPAQGAAPASAPAPVTAKAPWEQ